MPDVFATVRRHPRHAAAYIAIVLASVIVRCINVTLSDNGSPVFDEKHYATQAQQMTMLGIENNPGYGLVVHPPLGKAFISIGELLFGYTPLGWRLSSIIAGTTITATMMWIAWMLTKAHGCAWAVGVVSVTEGTLFTMSRTAMLDIFIGMCVVVGFAFLVKDLSTNTRYAYARRWWLAGAGFMFGLAMAVKVSGAYYAAAAGVVMVIVAIVAYRNIKDVAKATLWGLLYFAVIPIATFLATYIPWFMSENGVYRHAKEAGTIAHPLPERLQPFVPDALENFLSYQWGIAKFHTSLTSSAGNVHPWESKPWHWLMGSRPMLFLSENLPGDQELRLWLMGNMVVWLLFIPAALYLVVRLFKSQNKWQPAIVLMGMIVGYVPWLIGYDRQMYLFYVVPLAPFVVIGTCWLVWGTFTALGTKYAWASGKAPEIALWAYVTATVVFFCVYATWLFGIPASHDTQESLRLFDFWNAYTTR